MPVANQKRTIRHFTASPRAFCAHHTGCEMTIRGRNARHHPSDGRIAGGGKGSKIRDLSISLGYNPPLSSKGRAGVRRSARWFGSVGPLNVWSLAQAGAGSARFLPQQTLRHLPMASFPKSNFSSNFSMVGLFTAFTVIGSGDNVQSQRRTESGAV